MNTAIRSGFGEVLRRERVRIPLTLQELSAMSGVSPSHLGRIERGERSLNTVATGWTLMYPGCWHRSL